MALFVKRNDTGQVVKIRKYIIDPNGEESIWSNEWYGRHVIGRHCEWDNSHAINWLDLDGKTIPVTFRVSKFKPKICIDYEYQKLKNERKKT